MCSFAVGGRYWHFETKGDTHFEQSVVGGGASPQPVDWKSDIYGVFVQGSFKFGPYVAGAPYLTALRRAALRALTPRARSGLMNSRPLDRLAIALAQLNPDRRRCRRQCGQGAPRAHTSGGRGRRPDPVSRTLHGRLSAGRPRAQAGFPGGVPRGGRSAGARNGGQWSGRDRRHALGRRAANFTTPSRCSTAGGSRRCASRSICRITACSTKSACSRRGRCRVRSVSAACGSAFPFARTSGDRSRWNASPKPAAKSCWCRTARPIAAM